MNYVLASGSERRQELLHRIVDEFNIIVSDFDEDKILFKGNVDEYVVDLAKGKALSVKESLKEEAIIIAGDTVVVLDDNGKVMKVVAAHDIGRAVNPISVEVQIEGGVVMGLGYALTEDYPLKNWVPLAKLGTLGLFRSTGVPEIETILIEKNKSSLAYGAKGVGEIVVVPAAPAMQGAYYKLDGEFRTKLPLENTFYKKSKK